jgi:predicted alpha/beta-hydrolase family hydrolase
LKPHSLTINVEGGNISALYLAPAGARACYVLAHGAGAGMAHPFMAAVADGLAARGVGTLRYQFPYMERGSKRPDAPKVAHAAVRAAVAEAARLAPGLPLIAGGKSFGGRMTSQAQAASPLPGVRGLAFLGFPLHAAGQPSDERAKHLFEVKVPMLFLQGAADKLAEPKLLAPLAEKLRGSWMVDRGSSSLAPITLKFFSDADHSFHVPARTGRKDAEVMIEVLDALASWTSSVTQ